MRKVQSLALALVALTSLAACGRTGAPTAAIPGARAASMPAVMAAGVSRKLGYNVTRYTRVLKPKAHPIHLVRRGELPANVDNRANCSPVADQGMLGSCTAFAMGKGLREYMQRTNKEALKPLSALWLYYEERVHMGSDYVNEDSGANIIDGMAVLNEQGNATEETWPYKISLFKQKAPDAAYATAAEYKVKSISELATLDDVKTAIAGGKSVAFGFLVYSSFQWIGKTGVMPMPKPSEQVLGGHAVLAVGYDDAKQQLIVRNSWGGSWGDKGYFYMPYAFAKDTEKAMEWMTAE